jgi:CRP-like cAMP-binding protein
VTVSNRLIGALPRRERSRFLQDCEPVNLTFGQVLCEPDEPYRHAWFPLDGFISTVATVGTHQPLEVRLIGNEGMLGATLILGVNTVPLRAVVQGTGAAWRIGAAALRRALGRSPALRPLLSRYLYVLVAQLSQSTGCNLFHDVEARLARWLLMTHDRAHVDYFHLTHAFLADMLGVRRSGITVAAGALQQRRLIHYARGKISVLDRAGLEAASCDCYAALREDYAQVLG